MNLFEINFNNIIAYLFTIVFILAIYLLYRVAKKNGQSAKYYVDIFLAELIIGFLLSKIIFYIINFNTYGEVEWTWLPYRYIDTLSSAFTGFEFFTTFPWRIIYPSLNDTVHIGFVIVFCITPIICLYRNRELYFSLAEGLIFANISLVAFKIIYDLYKIFIVKEFSLYSYFDMNTSIFYLTLVIFILISNYILIKKRESDKLKFKAIRSRNNDLVKEIANWARLKKFTVTRHRENIVNNASLEDEKKDFERLWKNIKNEN